MSHEKKEEPREALIRERERLEFIAEHPHAPKNIRQRARGAADIIEALLEGGLWPSRCYTDVLVAGIQGKQIRCCCKCGCTRDYACAGGCAWSPDPNLCSRCYAERH